MLESNERARRLASAAGIELNTSKSRFVMSLETLVNLINGVAANEYIRGWNNQICAGCQMKKSRDLQRPFKTPDMTYDFCDCCHKKEILMKKL